MKRITGFTAGLMLAGWAGAQTDDTAPEIIERHAWMAEQGSLAWMEGHWRHESEGRISEEIWTNGEGGLMLGLNRTIGNGEARGFEYMRIRVRENLEATYCAQPGGGEAVCFDALMGSVNFNIETGNALSGTVTFVNRDHDFPQQIAYVREGNTLTATISDFGGGNAITFRWTRVED